MNHPQQVRYLLRLDDACPTMDLNAWTRIEALLDRHGVSPLVAVIPDNRDPTLCRAPADPDFWARVRTWRDRGSELALHGHHHLKLTREAGLVPFNRASEFAGLPLGLQRSKLAAGLTVFRTEGLEPRLFVAPWHSLDHVTLAALRQVTPIRCISDGLALRPFSRCGFRWLPQQTWTPTPRTWGFWTICLHPDNLGPRDLEALDSFLHEHSAAVLGSLDELLTGALPSSRGPLDYALGALILARRARERGKHAR